MKYFPIIILFLIGIAGCSSKSNSNRKPVTNIQISHSNNIISSGNDFTINISSRVTKPKIEKIELYLNNELIETSSDASFSVNISSKNYLPGKHIIKTVATNENNKTGINSVYVNILSDIKPEKISYKIIDRLPHNESYYTQGLEIYNGKIYEGTGNYGESGIFVYNPANGNLYNEYNNENQYFGEGISILNGKLYQLTYKAQKGFVYNVETLEKIDEFSYSNKEGWGLTNDGNYLIMSDGSSQLFFINPNNYKVEKTLYVTHPGGFVNNLNELEYVDGVIYANIWTTQTIAKIDADNGKVLAFIDMSGLLPTTLRSHIDVFNGIAYDKNEDLFYVTGKWWPYLFKVRFK
ncbi:MAG: glutaminyl-peptide cyclotransferase [Prolixibacteraceae bacterium]|jgi:glutamine cyclotransferase|nr:glutaminyl-peptide cyclotransferase [Prolixibacteraceae bacterium]